MDIVFLDTSIFIKENFLVGGRVNEFFSLAKKEHIRIVLTALTIDEIKNKFSNFIKITQLNLEKIEGRAILNTSLGKTIISNLDLDSMQKEFNETFDGVIRESKIEIIDYSKVDIVSILSSYFNSAPPFDTGKKKSEFPDAITLQLLEYWCAEHNEKCTVFSTDGDFLSYKSSNLIIRSDYEKWLSDSLKKIDKVRTHTLDLLYNDQRMVLQNEIKAWVFEQLGFFDAFDSFVNDHEIHDVSDVEVSITDDEYEIISLSLENDEIEIEVTVQVSIKAKVEADDPEFSFYDSDDKSVHYYDTATTDVDVTEEITCTFSISIVNEEDHDLSFTPTKFNNGKRLSISPGYDY